MPHTSTQGRVTAEPLRLLWYAKDVRRPFPGVTRVVVPIAGGPPPPDAEARLTEALERRWLMPPAGRPYATAIAVSLDREPRAMDGRAHSLVLVVSAPDDRCAPLHIDRMARHLRAALAQLDRLHANAGSASPAAPSTPSVDQVRHLLDPSQGAAPSRGASRDGGSPRSGDTARLARTRSYFRAARDERRTVREDSR